MVIWPHLRSKKNEICSMVVGVVVVVEIDAVVVDWLDLAVHQRGLIV